MTTEKARSVKVTAQTWSKVKMLSLRLGIPQQRIYQLAIDAAAKTWRGNGVVVPFSER